MGGKMVMKQVYLDKLMEMEQAYLDNLLQPMFRQLTKEDTKVVQYSIWDRQFSPSLMILPRYKKLEELLANKANGQIEEAFYVITLSNGDSFNVLCISNSMFIGLGIC